MTALPPPKKPKILLVSDCMITTVTSSTQETFKVNPISEEWYAMYAGEDVSMVDKICRLAYDILAPLEAASAANVESVMRQAYQIVRKKQIEDHYLSTYGWDMEQFLKGGRATFGDSEFSQLRYQIDQFDLKCEFLVSGFDIQDRLSPTLIRIQNPGESMPCILSYAAIGSGSPAALIYLDSRKQSNRMSLGQSIYNGIAAKAFAESAGALGVGQQTDLVIIESGERLPVRPNREQIEQIKDIWQKEEADIRPLDVDKRVAKILGF